MSHDGLQALLQDLEERPGRQRRRMLHRHAPRPVRTPDGFGNALNLRLVAAASIDGRAAIGSVARVLGWSQLRVRYVLKWAESQGLAEAASSNIYRIRGAAA